MPGFATFTSRLPDFAVPPPPAAERQNRGMMALARRPRHKCLGYRKNEDAGAGSRRGCEMNDLAPIATGVSLAEMALLDRGEGGVRIVRGDSAGAA
jgi:hypothetical protein